AAVDGAAHPLEELLHLEIAVVVHVEAGTPAERCVPERDVHADQQLVDAHLAAAVAVADADVLRASRRRQTQQRERCEQQKKWPASESHPVKLRGAPRSGKQAPHGFHFAAADTADAGRNHPQLAGSAAIPDMKASDGPSGLPEIILYCYRLP